MSIRYQKIFVKRINKVRTKKTIKSIISNTQLGNFVGVITKIFLIFVLIKLGVDVYLRCTDRKYHISEFSIPQSFNEIGINNTFISDMFFSNINFIDSTVINLKNNFGQFSLPQKKFDVETIESNDEIEYGGISYRRLVNFIANSISTPKYIKGAIVESNDEQRLSFLTISTDNKLSTHQVITDSLKSEDKLRLLCWRTAKEVYSKINPLQYSIFLFSMKDYQKCINFLNQYHSQIKSRSDLAYARFILGLSYEQLNQRRQAIEVFKQVSTENAYKSKAYGAIALNYMYLNHLDSTKLLISRIKKIDVYDYKNIMGTYFVYCENYDSALYFYKSCFVEKPSSYMCKNIIAAYSSINRFDSAELYFDILFNNFENNIISRESSYYLALGFSGGDSGFNNKLSTFPKLIKTKKELINNYKYCLLAIGQYYLHSSKPDSAYPYLEKLYATAPNFLDGQNMRAKYHSMIGEYSKANDFYIKTELQNKNIDKYYKDWAYNLLNQGDFNSALEKANILYDYFRGISYAYNLFGDIYERKGEIKKAEYFYKLNLDINNSNIYTIQQLARLKFNENKFEESLSYCNWASEIDTNSIQAITLGIENNLKMNRINDCKNQILKLLKKGDTKNYLYYNIILADINMESNSAIEYCDKLLKEDKKSVFALNYLGSYYLNSEKYSNAIEMYKKIEEQNAQKDYHLNNIGVCYDRLGKLSKAQEYYRRAFLMNKSNCLYFRNWVISYYNRFGLPIKDEEINKFRFFNTNCNYSDLNTILN